jgi:PBP1b-binding outer membrane lipoprotein LpoB
MKKSSISKILLASLSILILNGCSKSNDISTSAGAQGGTTVSTPSAPSFELAYVITPLTSDIRNITFNDENGNSKTVYDWDSFPGGIIEMNVSANTFKARISVAVGNTTGHPIGFRLEIRVNGKTKQTKDFTIPTLVSYATASAEYDVQND